MATGDRLARRLHSGVRPMRWRNPIGLVTSAPANRPGLSEADRRRRSDPASTSNRWTVASLFVAPLVEKPDMKRSHGSPMSHAPRERGYGGANGVDTKGDRLGNELDGGRATRYKPADPGLPLRYLPIRPPPRFHSEPCLNEPAAFPSHQTNRKCYNI